MKKMLLAAVAVATLTGSANAVTLIGAAVTGPTGTVWDTTQNSFYTLFLQAPGLGDFINPNDEAISANVADGANRFLLAGDGFPIGTNGDSDALYNLALTFDNGLVLTGQYTPTTNTFLGGPSQIVDGVRYTLNEFSYRRFLGDSVSRFTATPGDDGNDYTGNFRFTSAAVPEPATWAMMLGGFGLVGLATRRRTRTAVTYS